MKILSNEQRKKIEMYIKNGKDISELIEGYSLKNENFSRAIIKRLNRFNEDITNVNFSFCTIGEENIVTDLSGCDLKGCNFKYAKLLGRTVIRNADLRNVNMCNADLNEFDYQNSDFRGGVFCGCILKIGTSNGKGAIVDKKLLELLSTGWIVK